MTIDDEKFQLLVERVKWLQDYQKLLEGRLKNLTEQTIERLKIISDKLSLITKGTP